MTSSTTGHEAHEEHGHGEHSPFVQHHYDDAQHQFDSGKLGIWLFLAQEVLFFSALFVAYVLYRFHHPEIYSYAHQYLQVKFGAINTAVLIFSSLTAAWAVRCAQLNQRKGLILCIVLTLGCAMTFLVIKYIEYSHKVHEHILFGRYFDPCVSSGGTELLTKNNECAGTKSTIEWDFGAGKPKEGCYDQVAIDQDPQQPGIQASCDVGEYKVEFYHPPVYRGSSNHECKKEATTADKVVEKPTWPADKNSPYPSVVGNGGTYAFTGPCEHIIIKGDNNKVTIDSSKTISVQGSNNEIVANSADTVEVGGKNPSINVNRGVTSPKPAVSVLTGDLAADETEHSRVINRVAITEQCPEKKIGEHEGGEEHAEGHEAKEKFPCWRTAYQPAVCEKVDAASAARNEPKIIPQVGILVEYGDHDERGREFLVKADCKAPPKPGDAGDVFADKETHLSLGEKAIRPIHELTTHEEHALEAAGPPPEHTNMFFTIYFAMTGLHGIHVLVGVFVFIWLLLRAIKGHFTPEYFGPVDYAALYWHIVDLIWIFLFPLLYLIH
jgi:heme/copper-type cytochrome/quinol oxidase subunit 3